MSYRNTLFFPTNLCDNAGTVEVNVANAESADSRLTHLKGLFAVAACVRVYVCALQAKYKPQKKIV